MNTKQERAEFEAFMGKRCPNGSLKRFATGCYRVSMIHHHWEGWKARAALQSESVAGLVEALEMARDRIESERPSGEWDPLLEDIDAALATYRNQGGGK